MRISKLDVAAIQLDAAIRHFLEGDFLPALSLAGAAEEILGALSRRAGLPVAVEQIVEYHFKDTDQALPDLARRKAIVDILNAGRNQAKHANDPSEADFELEQIDSLQMIMRAMPMARRLGARMLREAEMVKWIRGHPEALQ
jgi:hypothetical protein